MPQRKHLYAVGSLGLALALTSGARGDPGDGDDDNGGGSPDPSTFAVIAESSGDVEYTAEFDAEYVNPSGSGDLAAEDNDDITDNGDGTYTVEGFTGNAGYGDTFEYVGDLTHFEAPGASAAYRLEIDGVDVTDDWVDDPGSPGGDPNLGDLGGGPGYADAVAQSDADYVAGSRSELDSALSQASSGEVVFLAADLPRDGSGDGVRVPSGVTLASGRGTSDPTATLRPRGGEDWSTYHDMAAVKAEQGARVTGLVVEGHETRYRNAPSRGGVSIWGRGMATLGPGVRFDNCEVYGNERGIQCNHPAVVEYCDVHHQLQGGFGYGVRAQAADVQIRYNTFDYNRHSVASSSNSNEYHCHDNWFGPNHVGHVLDHHDGGADTNIHHNRIETVDRPTSIPSLDGMEIRGAGARASSVTFRGVPVGDAAVHHNWFSNPDGPIEDVSCGIGSGSDWHCPAVNQVNDAEPDEDGYIDPSDSQYRNLSVHDNHYGSGSPDDSDVGVRT